MKPPTSPSTIAALLALTFVTGIIDAVSVLGLGHVFVSNMTGNVVFLGFALAGAGVVEPAAPMVALVAFMFGALIGGRLLRRENVRTSVGFLLELALLLVASAIGSLASRSQAHDYALITCLAVTMGLRNALVRALAIPDITTTVLTSTITGLAAESSLAGGSNPRSERRVGAIGSMLTGALCGALLLGRAPRLAVAAASVLELVAMAVLLRSGALAPRTAA